MFSAWVINIMENETKLYNFWHMMIWLFILYLLIHFFIWKKYVLFSYLKKQKKSVWLYLEKEIDWTLYKCNTKLLIVGVLILIVIINMLICTSKESEIMIVYRVKLLFFSDWKTVTTKPKNPLLSQYKNQNQLMQ